MNLYESVKNKLNEREEECSWSEDGKHLNIREMVARVLENAYPDKDFTDEEIEYVFGTIVDTGPYMEEIFDLLQKQAVEIYAPYSNSIKESGERFQIRKYDKTGAPYGIYDMKSKKFVKRGEKKNLEKELKERNEKDKMQKESQSLKEGTFGEEVGFDEYASIDEMEYNFAHDLLEYLGTSVDYASWVDFNKFELHRGTSWVDDNAWMRVDLEIPDNTVYEIINQHKDQYPTASELGDDLSIYSTGIEIGGAGKGFYNVRTYTTFEPHYSWYYDENGENKDRAVTKAVEDKLSAEEDVLCEYIDKIVTEHYKDLLQIMLDNEYYDEDYEEEEDE